MSYFIHEPNRLVTMVYDGFFIRNYYCPNVVGLHTHPECQEMTSHLNALGAFKLPNGVTEVLQSVSNVAGSNPAREHWVSCKSREFGQSLQPKTSSLDVYL